MISIVIPSFRRGAKIEKTLRSIEAQALQPDEVIVVNDGGFFETTQYVHEHFPKVTVLDIAHGGAAIARNTGVKAARNAIVALIDDDDTLRPEGLKLLYETLTTFPEARAAHGDNSFTHLGTGEHRERNNRDIPALSEKLARITPLKSQARAKLFGKNLYYAMLKGNLIQQPWMFYRDIYLEVGGFQSGLVSADDWDLYLRITRKYPVALTNELIGHQYAEPGRPHLTTDPRQRQGQMEAARRQLVLAGWADFRAVISLRKTLGGHHKALGDDHLQESPSDAWQEYWQSWLYWPFDTMVALRTLLILPLRVAAHRISRSPKPVKQGPAS
ncbi:MAG: glycosyltransferase family 2 protein [Planctomycetia bacterium]|nr:glycosyltransferase family 2 protein [Planctomycetia bacterium]